MSVTPKDRALLNLLLEDGRASVSSLAQRLGVTRSTVQARIARLSADGVISGFTVRTGPAADEGQITMLVCVVVMPQVAQKITEDLKSIAEVRRVYAVNGQYDLFVEVMAPNVSNIDRVIDQIGALPGVERTLSMVVLATKLDRR
ncbi:MAG: Lrp/AsnC family transcriptional regulator [Pseudomonadota bacterium]